MNPIGPFSVSNLPAIKDDQGIWRVLGCLPETQESKTKFATFGTAMMNAAGLDQSQWQEIDLAWYNPPVLDQGLTSACVGHSACGGMHMCWLQSGRPLVPFNPYFVYGLINGGRDQGAMISDALQALMQYGICEKDALPSGMMFQNQFPQSAFENAAKYKLIKAYHCGSFEEICGAITMGFVCPLGIMVGSNFPQLDAEGVAPLPRGGQGGHAILGCGLKKSSRYGWLIKILNSWSDRFGMRGYCYIHKGHFRSMNPDAFAIQQISSTDESIPVAV